MISQIQQGLTPIKATEKLKKKLTVNRGKLFHPKLVKIFFNHLLHREALWFELYSDPSYLKETVTELLENFSILITKREFLKIIELFGYIIDFKSKFTATHSSGVAQVAVQLALYMSFSQDEVKKMRIAGLLHDVGKIAIPSEILEKPGKLTEEEYNLMKSHVFHTYKILSRFIDDDNIVEWASYHHEKLTGNGYPFKLKAPSLSRGARIMAVADIFTALTEERPYKKGLSARESIQIIKSMAENEELDREVVKTFERNLTTINKARIIAQEKALEVYKSLKRVSASKTPIT